MIGGSGLQLRSSGVIAMMEILKKLFEKKPKVTKIDLTKRFDLISPVGQGSMSKVWRARDVMTGRQVALKVLDKVKTEKLEQRFKGLRKPIEGEIAIGLKHPNIVQTIEHGWTLEREQFLVMEFIEGSGLSYFIDAQDEIMQTHGLNFTIELGDAIEYFHGQGWIHRDICPRNVIITQDHHVKLIDFGLVVPNQPEFKRPGNRTGSANYMAPELIKRRPTDERIDLYSYAVTCYEMWTKRLPWPKTDSIDAAVQHINNPPDPIRNHAPELDPEIAETIMKGLAREPDERWKSAREMTQRFRAAAQRLNLAPIPPRP
jgi:eukaryotic-like serine/threonine-protein kinase